MVDKAVEKTYPENKIRWCSRSNSLSHYTKKFLKNTVTAATQIVYYDTVLLECKLQHNFNVYASNFGNAFGCLVQQFLKKDQIYRLHQ